MKLLKDCSLGPKIRDMTDDKIKPPPLYIHLNLKEKNLFSFYNNGKLRKMYI